MVLAEEILVWLCNAVHDDELVAKTHMVRIIKVPVIYMNHLGLIYKHNRVPCLSIVAAKYQQEIPTSPKPRTN